MGNHLRLSIAVLAWLALLFAAAGPAQAGDWWDESARSGPLDCRVVKRPSPGSPIFDAAARVDWIDQYIEVVAGATVDPSQEINLGHAISIGSKTARHLAYEKLAETIRGIQIDSRSRYDRELMLDADLATAVNGLVRWAKVVREEQTELADGSIWVTVGLGVRLVGERGSLMAVTAPSLVKDEGWSARSYRGEPAGYTGLIIDASGLGAKPAMAPRVVTPAGETVYALTGVSRQYAISQGLMGYSRSLDEAAKMARVGARPLVVKAIGTSGPYRADLVVKPEDAARIIRADQAGHFLAQCRVVVVIN